MAGRTHRLQSWLLSRPKVVGVAAFGVSYILIQTPPQSWLVTTPVSLVFAWAAFALCNSWLRDRNRAENQERVIAEINHHVNNALTIIRGRKLLQDPGSDQIVEGEVERIRWAITEVLPTIRMEAIPIVFESSKYRNQPGANPSSKV